jgi:hypothetical protein
MPSNRNSMKTYIFYVLLILQLLLPFGVMQNVFGQES